MGGILEAFLAGKEARRVADAQEQINAMSAFIGQNGAAIMGGDQNALGQLAGFGQQGLQMAMGIQGDVQARERQAALDAQAADDRAYTRTRQEKADQRSDQKWEMELAEYKKGLSAEQAATEAAQLEEAAKMALTATSPEQWDQLATENGAPELVGQFDNREAVAARFMSMAEVLKQVSPEPPKPTTEVAKLKADLDAGLIDQATYEAELARRAPKGTSLTVDPATGQVTFQEGVGVAGGGATSGDALRASMTDAQNVVALIDEIANDPALPGVTGSLEGGGGNNVDDFSMMRRAYYGDAGLSVIQKIAQLQGNAWLGARALLKGGGAITDYESKKAEGAMARLSRAQGDAEFKAALKDLQDALREGMAKLNGEGGSGSPSPATGFDQTEIDQLMLGP